MSLTTPETVRKLQRTLHVKAKEAPDFRFYTLYDKVYRLDVLAHGDSPVSIPKPDLRKEMGQNSRNTILAVVGMMGVFTTVIIAFMRYGLTAG